MFDLFSGQHILLLLVVLLVVVGPKDLPRLMHQMGQWAGKARRMADEFKRSFDDMARQEELEQLRAELEQMHRAGMEAPKLDEPSLAEPAPSQPEPRSGEFLVTETPKQPEAAGEPPQAP